MTTTHPYAHHLRYQLTAADYTALRSRLIADNAHCRTTGIHTLRFASYRGALSDARSQDIPADLHFSLHYYDNDPSYLRLVRQSGGESTYTIIAEAECRALLAGETDWLLERYNPVLQDFYEGLTDQLLLPQVMLSYQREVYHLDGLDLWVALDTDIRSSLEHMHFLDPELLERDSACQEKQFLLEVSYSNEIPDELLCLFEETAPRRKLLSSALRAPARLPAFSR